MSSENTATTVAPTPGERYGLIDGLRTFAAIGVVLMHIKANGGYIISGFISNRCIGSMGEFVYLFMIISGFSMCCGYFDKVTQNKISVTEFYNKRYAKIWPYFALLCFVDVVMFPSKEALYELFANLTLCFGLLPNANISVIGVGWFLGLCFVFYLLFPFFCFLLSDKRRAWASFVVTLVFNLLCKNYFFNKDHMISNFDMRSNVIYCAVFFLTGGIIYLYRKEMSRIATAYRWAVLGLCVMSVVAFLYIGSNVITLLVMFSMLLIYAIGDYRKKGIFSNKCTHFISGISMEIYLGHMIFFRMVEKVHLAHIFENHLLSYVTAVFISLISTIIFAVVVKKCFAIAGTKYRKIRKIEEYAKTV